MSTVSSSTPRVGDRPRIADDLIFDVGMHRGEDTAYYLRKGFRVVAFEAQPDLIAHSRQRFASELEDGRLTIVPGAIIDGDQESVTFYTHSRMTTWGTTLPSRADRNEVMGPSTEITVPAVDFATSLRRYGVPHYLKIDIEAADMLCLEALLDVDPANRPRYTSVEAESETWPGVIRQFDVLEQLGYTRFAIVQQAKTGEITGPVTTRDGDTFIYRHEMYSSGPFGDDLNASWLDKAEALRRYRWLLVALRAGSVFDRVVPKGPTVRFLAGVVVRHPLPGWFDIHAARS